MAAGAEASALFTLGPMPTTTAPPAPDTDSQRMPPIFLPDRKMSLGHFTRQSPRGTRLARASHTANPAAKDQGGKSGGGLVPGRPSIASENVNAPCADHQRFAPRPRPSVWRSASTSSGSFGSPRVANSRARSLVDPSE